MNHEINNQGHARNGASVRKNLAARTSLERTAKNSVARKRLKSNLQPTRGAGRPKSYGSNDDLPPRRGILEAALQCFSLYGFDGASITRIARTHGVSPPLIHYYFETK